MSKDNWKRKDSRKIYLNNPLELLPISQIVQQCNLSKYAIYELIRSDPTFPAINIGPKKNYRIQPTLLEEWFKQKSRDERNFRFNIPSTSELLSMSEKWQEK